jgi:hypothetical protein
MNFLELLFSLITVVITITAAGWMLKFEWDKGQCAYIVFERTHAQIADSTPPSSPWGEQFPVQIEDRPDSTEGTALCGQSSESVTLPKLEPQIQGGDL